VVNVFVNLALIPWLGATGVALGLLSGGLCSATLRYRCITTELGPKTFTNVADGEPQPAVAAQ
jgi:hypothetical protein